MLHPLDRKLLRDLWRLRVQALAIALIIASGVAVIVMSLAAIEALEETAATYYERYRFADVFVHARRAPESVARRVAALPGVRVAESRIQALATLDVADFPEPVLGSLVSIPDTGQPTLDRLALRAGRWIEPGRPHEVLVNESFAEGHGLEPGARFSALMNGRKRELTIVGIALSPEYVYAIGPGALMPDSKRYGVVWMSRDALEAAYDLEGSFNDLTVSLYHGSDAKDVLDGIDALLDPYGGMGAYERADQISNWFLANEIEQLRSMAQILPTIFLVVAAFLTNMVLARLIAIERSEIGLLKAFGYGDFAVGWHYVKLVIVLAAGGIAIGWVVGDLFGRWTTAIYADFFRFPVLFYDPSVSVFLLSAVISLAAALAGAVGAVRRAMALPPAEAMRPPAPPTFRGHADGDGVLARLLDQPTRIILRQALRFPLRTFLTSLGLAASVSVLVVSMQWMDAINELIDDYFWRQQRQDAMVGLVELQDADVLHDVARLPGVLAVEGHRAVAARLSADQHTRREALIGMPSDSGLEILRDADGLPVPMPADGLLMSTTMASLLEVGVGDLVHVEILEGRRERLSIPVSATFETLLGTPVYIDLQALNRRLDDPPLINMLLLKLDRAREPDFFSVAKVLPSVSGVMLRRAAVNLFQQTIAETMLIYTSFYVIFACVLSFGVVYNNLRIALSERGRELATLRVLGFRTSEIGYMLLGEAALTVVIAVPVGCLLGYGLAWLISEQFASELFRVPLAVVPDTFGRAILVTLAAVTVCAIAMERRLERLDLIAVLKTRE
ncbi:MAG: ABC transporter permease [Pseudomonadales bacterium]|jgi:putative ABC transport system permease protein|nr:ABC transporter permease [Pseudomonadales bacterium]